MTSWRDAILNEFVPGVSKLTLVADPDCLLTEERLTLALRERGFDVIDFNDSVEFRYVYELQYRSKWDLGEQTERSVILRLQGSNLETLPYDLLQAGRKLSFDLGTIFPNLSYPVVERLDRNLLDSLFDAQQKYPPDRMGDNATKDFVLRHVFGIAAELIGKDVDLLRMLLHVHYGNRNLPGTLADRLVGTLSGKQNFRTWPLAEIVVDQDAFFAFLQERWPVFLSGLGIENQVRDIPPASSLRFSGPEYLPFDHQDIRVYIDNLFLEGKLSPVAVESNNMDAESWVRSGLSVPGDADNKLRISRLFELVNRERPNAEAIYADWIAFALKWAELSSLVHRCGSVDERAHLKQFGDALNLVFADWLAAHYDSLINLPPNNPAMLHHVPRRLARDIESSGSGRTALIVVDGLALDQWVTIRELLHNCDHQPVMRETAAFAWVPTLTSVSRQSIFSGKPPLYFASTILTTNKEEKHWQQFWEGSGLRRRDIVYRRGLGKGNVNDDLDDMLSASNVRVLGLVIDTPDKIMHGMQLGSQGMHDQLKLWLSDHYLIDMVNALLDSDLDVWLTADHGNIQCSGQGRPSEGAIAESRGERARIYPSAELRAQVAESHTFATTWDSAGLPPDIYPLVTGGHDAFVKPGETIVGHGGIAIEEVIVPLVKFERNAN